MYWTLKQYEDILENIDWVSRDSLKRIEEKSSYNNNYYVFNVTSWYYTILWESDDDNTTTWYWCLGTARLLIGYSYTSKDDIIQVSKGSLC